MSTIAFIGLGNMGGPMAANLVKAGHRVLGFDLVAELREDAAKTGVEIGASLAAIAAEADSLITMLPNGKAVLAVWTEALKAARAGVLLIDSSTIDVDSARKAHEIAKSAGFSSVDAPVSGGTGGAAAATLTFMCGGEMAAFERARPILEKWVRKLSIAGLAVRGKPPKSVTI